MLLGFTGSVQCSSSNAGSVYFNVAVDGVDYVADDGIVRNMHRIFLRLQSRKADFLRDVDPRL